MLAAALTEDGDPVTIEMTHRGECRALDVNGVPYRAYRTVVEFGQTRIEVDLDADLADMCGNQSGDLMLAEVRAALESARIQPDSLVFEGIAS